MQYHCILCGESEETHCKGYVETYLNPPIVHENPRFKVGEFAIAKSVTKHPRNYIPMEREKPDGFVLEALVKITEIRPKVISNVWEYVFDILNPRDRLHPSFKTYYGYDNLEMRDISHILLFKFKEV